MFFRVFFVAFCFNEKVNVEFLVRFFFAMGPLFERVGLANPIGKFVCVELACGSLFVYLVLTLRLPLYVCFVPALTCGVPVPQCILLDIWFVTMVDA